MKKQKIILYLVALVCFMVCFIVLNRKYDSFYRISGINNETRQLIINNLTEEEQEYLIENSFPTKRFLRFLTHPDFHLHDLEYYEKIEKQTELSIDGVVEYTNSLLEKIRSEEIRNVDSIFQKLTDTSLADLYLVSEDFDLELLDLYHHFTTLNQGIDLYAVNQINALATAMSLEGMDEKEKYKNAVLASSSEITGTELENRIENILNKIDGVGEVSVLLTYDDEKLEGIVVVAEGANNLDIKINIISAIEAVTGLGKHKIKVYEMNEIYNKGGNYGEKNQYGEG